MGFFDQAGKKISAVQKKAGDSISARKLQAQIKNVESEIGRMYAAIGEKCYKAHAEGANPEGLDIFYANITTLNAKIADIKEELDRLNNVIRCESCNAAVERGVRFCPNCGARMPAPEVETCPDCGAVRADNARFCESCGHRFEIPVDEAPAPAAETADAPVAEDDVSGTSE